MIRSGQPLRELCTQSGLVSLACPEKNENKPMRSRLSLNVCVFLELLGSQISVVLDLKEVELAKSTEDEDFEAA